MAGKSLKIVSFNVNSLKTLAKNCKQKTFASYLRSEFGFVPDIVAFQETKFGKLSDVPEDLAVVDGYESYWDFSGTGYSGTVTYVRKGLTIDAQCGFSQPKWGGEGRVVQTTHPGFILFNVYFPNGGTGAKRLDYKMGFCEAFLQHCQNLLNSGKQVVVVGDFNTCHRDIDIHDHKIKKSGVFKVEREWMDRFVEAGFTDTYRHFFPDKKNMFTWWDLRTEGRPVNRGWRLDYAFVSKGVLQHVDDAGILTSVKGSDHCPITLFIRRDIIPSSFEPPSAPPALCAALSPNFSRKQSKLSSFFSTSSSTSSASSVSATKRASSQASVPPSEEKKKEKKEKKAKGPMTRKDTEPLETPSSFGSGDTPLSSAERKTGLTRKMTSSTSTSTSGGNKAAASKRRKHSSSNKAATTSGNSILSFFKRAGSK